MADEGIFGQFGNATYDEENHEWHFARDFDSNYRLIIASDIDIQETDSEPARLAKNGDTRDRQIQTITSVYADVQPAHALLPNYLGVSRAVAKAAANLDPALGPRVSVSTIYDINVNRPVRIIAWTSGPTASDITIAKLTSQRQGWHDSHCSWLSVPVLSTHQSQWYGPGAPIQQLCLAQTNNANTSALLLGVRLLNRSIIFEVVARSNGLAIEVVQQISLKDCFSQNHAHIAFNPWYCLQYVVVDIVGNWKIWQMERAHGTRATLVAQYEEQATAVPSADLLEDGWMRASWIGGPNLLAVCSRTQISLYNIGPEVVRLRFIDAHLSQDDCWILDVTVLNSFPNVFFVLTGVYLLAFEVQDGHDGVEVRRIVKIRHHINKEDLTLRMHVFAAGNDAVVLLGSTMSKLGLCYKLSDLDGTMTNTNGPSTVDAPPLLQGSVSDLAILPASFKSTQPSGIAQSTAGFYQQNIESAFQILHLKHDFDIGALLACTVDDNLKQFVFRGPEWKTRLRNMLPSTIVDDFIVDDDDDNDEDDEDDELQQEPVSRFVQRLRQYEGRHGLRWTIDLSRVTDALSVMPQGITPDVQQALDRAEQMVRSATETDDPSSRLLDDFSHSSTVNDIDLADTVLGRLLTPSDNDETQPNEQARMTVRRLPLSCVPALQDQANFSANYDAIIADWITPLPSAINGRVRLAKERLARQTAAEVTLASHVLRREQSAEEPPAETQQKVELPTYEMSLPIRKVPMATSQSLPMMQASALPTPSPTATPSVLTHASQSSAYAPQKYYLPSITTFSKPLPVSLPRIAQRVLRHWEPGTDVADYDWQSYSRRITRQTEMEDLDSQLTEKERLRLQRKAERLLKRERKEAAATQQQQVLSSQLPELTISASQPAARTNTTSYSQPVVAMNSSQSQPMAASQVVHGRHAARPMKKKRKQGF